MVVQSFQCDTKIVIGKEASKEIASLLKENFPAVKRVMLVSDKVLVAIGLVAPILDNLKQHGYETIVFDGVSQNPRDTECIRGAEIFRQEKIDLVLAIGGGSPIDTAKSIALLGPNGGTPLMYFHQEKAYENIAPIVCVPTTAGTGSEVTRSAVITIAKTHQKITLKHAALRPSLAILDASLTLSVPPHVTAATGVDALVHAIEGYTCKVSNPVSQSLGREAMRLIIHNLPKAYLSGDDSKARSKMLEGSLLAGMCFGSADVAAVHCLAEALGSLYDTPHGIANAVFLPYVMEFNAEANKSMHAQLASIMNFASVEDTEEEAVTKLVEGIKTFTNELGISKLSELPGVKKEDIDKLAELAFVNGSTPSNVRDITVEDYKTILEKAFSDQKVLS